MQRTSINQSEGISSIEAASQAWSLICENIKCDLPAQTFQTWFSPVKALNFENQTLKIEVPSKFYHDWIESHYSQNIKKALKDTLGDNGRLIYSISSEEEEIEAIPQAKPVTTKKTPYFSSSSNTNGHNHNGNSRNELNPLYQFNNFIEGPGNNFARAASYAVASSPGKTAYNPLLVYGGVGLGKTHLLQAIGNESLNTNPDLKIRYISSERFTQDFVESIRKNRALEFSARYREIDVLLLDDIQFLIDRERTQMEFFHTFNSLHQAGKQIVLTSDKPPRELGGLDERLVSRIGWGLVCDISPPDYDTRLAIIQRFSDEEFSELPPEVCGFLAQNITNNIRELQGALIRLFAHANLKGADITLDLAKLALRDLFKTKNHRIPVDLIQRLVSENYDIPPDLLISKTRTQPVARVRMIAMALCSRLTELSLKQIGRHFGNRDHTTVLHARESVEKWEKGSKDFSAELENITKRIKIEAA